MHKKKKKVLVVHNYYKIPGGEDTVVANEIKLLEDNNHDVILYSRNNNEMSTMGKIRKLFLPFISIYNPQTSRDITRIIKQKKIDIVHVHNTLNLVSPSVYYASLKCGVPVVQTVHNFRLLCPAATFCRDGNICEDCVRKGMRCAIRHKCYRGDRIQTLICVLIIKIHKWTGVYKKINYICLTKFNQEKLLLLNKNKQIIDPSRIFVKPNFTFDLSEAKYTMTKSYYLFIGRIEDIKGIDILLKAFSKAYDKKLRLAGTSKDIKEYEKRATDNVQFLGHLNFNQLFTQIVECKAVIVPSQCYETFGMTIIEAYAVHKPVIVGDIGNISDLVENNVTGVKFKYNDADSLVEAINRFEKMDIKQLGENGYNYYRKNFSPEENYRKILKIYDTVC